MNNERGGDVHYNYLTLREHGRINVFVGFCTRKQHNSVLLSRCFYKGMLGSEKVAG